MGIDRKRLEELERHAPADIAPASFCGIPLDLLPTSMLVALQEIARLGLPLDELPTEVLERLREVVWECQALGLKKRRRTIWHD